MSLEDFAKLSLREQNEINQRLAKRYNQRIKTFYKNDPYHALKIYEYNDVEVGKPVFTVRKSLTEYEAKHRYSVMQKFNESKYASITKYKAYKKEAVKQLGVNAGLLENKEDTTISNDDLNLLAGFFDYIYDDLGINKSEYNYRELTDFFSLFKMTESEHENRLEAIKQKWREFKESNTDLIRWQMEVQQKLAEQKKIEPNDPRPYSQILRDRAKKAGF